MSARRFVPAAGVVSLRPLGLLLTVILLAAAVAPRAAAQGTDGTLPDPISAGDLNRYADRLGLSPQQRLGLESLHEQYKVRFRALRESEIARFLKESQEMGGGMMPQREQIEKMLDTLEALQVRIRALDEQFLTHMQPMLTEAQAAMLPRVRLLRERERYMTQQMTAMTMGQQIVDLSDLFFDLGLSPAAFATADPSMALYERRLTSELGKLSEAGQRMLLDMFEEFEARGFGQYTEEDLQRPEVMQKLGETMQQIWVDLTVNMREIAAEIGELNGQTCRTVAAVLPPDEAHALRWGYYRKAYPEVAGLLSRGADTWFSNALHLESLTPEAVQAIGAAQEQYRTALDRLLQQAVDAADERRANTNPMAMDASVWQQFNETMQGLQADAQRLFENADHRLKEILDPDQLAQIRGGPAPSSDEEQADEDAVTEEADAEIMASMATPNRQYVPGPLSRQEISGCAELLGLDPDQRAVLGELHGGYLTRYRELPALDSLREAEGAQYSYFSDETIDLAEFEQRIENLYRLRRQAFEAVRALDESFFDDMAGTLLGEKGHEGMERIRLRRLHRAYATEAGGFSFGPEPSAEGNIDLLALVERAALAPDAAAAIDPVLAGYEQASLDPARERFEAQVAYSRAQEVLNFRMYQAQREGGNVFSEIQNLREALAEPSQRQRAANEAVAALNRTTLDQLVAVLPAASAREVRQMYLRRAHPQVYNDPACIDEQLTEAMGLEDLTAEQRGRLNDLAAAFRPEYERLSIAMVDASQRITIDPMSSETQDWQAWQEKQRQMQTLRFERDELNFRTINRLKALLREDQLRRLGALPEPPKDEGFEVYW